jgi:hypothetical protein
MVSQRYKLSHQNSTRPPNRFLITPSRPSLIHSEPTITMVQTDQRSTIILLSGYARAGKDTFAMGMQDICDDLISAPIAFTLKEICDDMVFWS